MLKDLHHGVRALLHAKGWTAVVVISLALGIGANTALFSAINGLFLRKLPVRDPDTLVRFRFAGRNDMATSSSGYGFSRKDATGLGIGIGLAVAVAASRLVTSLLFGLPATDAVTMFVAVTVMVIVSAIAGHLPARRAAHVDPLVALHYE